MERVNEADELLSSVKKELVANRSFNVEDVGFAEERLFSALTWARFFDGDDKSLVIDVESLKGACASKISEAEERYNYVKSLVPEALDNTRKDIDRAYDLLNGREFVMCIYSASKAKSEADVLLSLFGVEEKRFDEVIGLKLDIARQALLKAQSKGVFPIIAYSYYEYSDSLRDFDRVSSLLFSEYALELSNLDIYFVKKQGFVVPEVPMGFVSFVVGLFIGGLFVWVILCQIRRASSSGVVQTLQAPSKRRLRGKKR
jgi:predicted S18 family serine protease